MGRGRKICPSCGHATGPRSFTCPACSYEYNVQKGVTKLIKGKNGNSVEDWRELEVGDCIKVISGSGPYWPLNNVKEDGTDKEHFGYSGLFKIHRRNQDGLLCYPLDKKNSGACFIYMGPKKESRLGAILRPHKIRKVDSKFIDSERRKSNV